MGIDGHDGTPAAAAGDDRFTQVLGAARATFDASTDFTLGVEEEYAIVDPVSLDLVPDFELARVAALEQGLETAIAGELLAAEVEFRTGACASYADAVAELRDLRARVAALLHGIGRAGGTSGVHPWADYREQTRIQDPYYDKLTERLAYVAHRNNTFGLHVHVGVRGAERAMAVANSLRDVQPLLLALSGSSPFLDGVDCGLTSARSYTFSRTFPRGNIAPTFASFDDYLAYVAWLRDTGSAFTPNQMWWGVRPHLAIGTVELRMFDAQPDVEDTLALLALAQGLVARACAAYDAGELAAAQPAYLVDENVWRASRWGTAARMVDLPGSGVRPMGEILDDVVSEIRPIAHAAGLGIDAGLDRVLAIAEQGCSAIVQRRIAEEDGIEAAYRHVVDTTMVGIDVPA